MKAALAVLFQELLEWLAKVAKRGIEILKARAKLKKEQEANQEANETYENKPSDDTFGDSA